MCMLCEGRGKCVTDISGSRSKRERASASFGEGSAEKEVCSFTFSHITFCSHPLSCHSLKMQFSLPLFTVLYTYLIHALFFFRCGHIYYTGERIQIWIAQCDCMCQKKQLFHLTKLQFKQYFLNESNFKLSTQISVP